MPASSIALRDLLVDQLAGLHQQLRIAVLVELVRIGHVFARHGAEDPLAQRLDDVLAFLERRRLEAHASCRNPPR